MLISNAYEEWFMSVCRPRDDHPSVVASLHLERYVRQEDVGDPGRFAFFTMHHCLRAISEIAEVARSGDVSYFMLAASWRAAIIMRHIFPTVEIDARALGKFIAEPANDRSDKMALAYLLKAMLEDKQLWGMLRRAVIAAASQLSNYETGDGPPCTSKRDCLRQIGRVLSTGE